MNRTELTTSSISPQAPYGSLPSEDTIIVLGWGELYCHLKFICDTLNSGGTIRGFSLRAGTTLKCRRPHQRDHSVECLFDGRDCEMWFRAELDVAFVEYMIDPSPICFQRIITVHGPQAFLCDRSYNPPLEQSMEDAADALMFEFLKSNDRIQQ
jgi:hypothetical protein